MAKFKNLHSKSGKITFENQRIEFTSVLETGNKSLINELTNSEHWIRLEEPEEKNKKPKPKKNISLEKTEEKINENELDSF